jgi:hypothetical protein
LWEFSKAAWIWVNLSGEEQGVKVQGVNSPSRQVGGSAAQGTVSDGLRESITKSNETRFTQRSPKADLEGELFEYISPKELGCFWFEQANLSAAVLLDCI